MKILSFYWGKLGNLRPIWENLFPLRANASRVTGHRRGLLNLTLSFTVPFKPLSFTWPLVCSSDPLDSIGYDPGSYLSYKYGMLIHNSKAKTDYCIFQKKYSTSFIVFTCLRHLTSIFTYLNLIRNKLCPYM